MPLSLECPRCNGAVSVSEQSAGKRVKCPHCESTFLAPGVTPTIKDDDDWLQLDDSPAEAEEVADADEIPYAEEDSSEADITDDQPLSHRNSSLPDVSSVPSSGPSPADDDDDDMFGDDFNLADLPESRSQPKSSLPGIGDDDDALLAAFAEADDDFTAEVESPPPRSLDHDDVQNPITADGESGASSLRKTDLPTPSKATKASAPTADDVEFASEYRIKCNVCGTSMYAKARQAGTIVKCPDCYSSVTVPAAPRVRKKQVVNMDEVESFGLEDNSRVQRGPDPYQRSAAQLLEEASREDNEEAEKPDLSDTPSVAQWFKNVFGIFTDISVLAHWLVLSVFASVPAVLALASGHPMVILALFPGAFFLGLLVISGGFAILNAVANGEDQVEDWPTLDPVSWFDQLFVVVAAALVAFLPCWLVTMIILGPSMLALAITMFSVYALFPFVLLSMLDMNTPFIPFSAEVARSVTKCEEAWGGFYFSSAIVFIGLFLAYTIMGMVGTMGVAISITLTVGAAFCYFAMLGRLAYAIGQAVNAPPRHDEDLDRTRHHDVA